MSRPERPEDVLGDGIEQATFRGVTARGGSVAAFVANAKLLQTLGPGGVESQAVVAEMRALLPALRAVGLLDVFTARSPAVAALIDDGPDGHIHQVVGAVLVHEGRALLVHRSPSRRFYPNVWDLPGGHIEPGEDSRAALIRELREELGVDAVVDGPPIARTVADTFVMDVWVVRSWTGEPVNVDPTEHDAIAWLTPDELDGLSLAHPDVPQQVRRSLEP